MILGWGKRHARYRRKMFRNIAREGALLAWTVRPRSRSFRLGVLTAMVAEEVRRVAREDYAQAREAFGRAWDLIDHEVSKLKPSSPPVETIARAVERTYRQSAYAVARAEKVAFWRSKASVYFIRRADGDGPIKIGVSADPRVRLRDLQVGSAFPLRIVATMPGDDDAEMGLHNRFAADRMSGEWFRASPALLDFIASFPATAEAAQ